MASEIESYFNQYLQTPSIFKDKTVFQPNYAPSSFSHRNEQTNALAAILAPALRTQKASNVFIYGKTGTGKTLCTHHVTNHMEHIASTRNIPLTVLSVNCKLRRIADTEYRLIAELSRHLGVEVPPTGLPTEEVYATFLKALETRSHTIILILDEIDHLVAKAGSDILYNLTRLNGNLKNAQLSIVGISNDALFANHLDPRVKSSLSEEEMIFPPYNALQIKSILSQRAALAFQTNTIEPGVIEKCAAFAAREHGDARRAIELLRVAGEIAERNQSTKLLLSHMDKAKEKVEHDRLEDLAISQPKQYQAVLLSIIRLSQFHKINNPKNPGPASLFTGEVYELYARVCENAGLRPLTQRRISDIIAEFDMMGIINAKIISKGRYGRTREISLSLAPTMQERFRSILERSLDLGKPSDTNSRVANSSSCMQTLSMQNDSNTASFKDNSNTNPSPTEKETL